MKNKKLKKSCLYLTDDALKKLDLIKDTNCMSYSAIVNYLIYKQKKIKLF